MAAISGSGVDEIVDEYRTRVPDLVRRETGAGRSCIRIEEITDESGEVVVENTDRNRGGGEPRVAGDEYRSHCHAGRLLKCE
ncbi:hypothetical protein GCM10011588_15490 [Nocardia jinanensis]|uniref:Uncharacterized protein n=1 Tax=Nocardia jinanensis TaxID=382504 RepID=A0A917RCT3_9NOCA|nr:hypothetical protein GCM10011588_15490 [Nocardia jinanensis]